MIQQRSDMCHARRLLTTATDEAVELCQFRNVPFMRDVSHSFGNVESSLCADCVLGLPTVGSALHTPTQIQRVHCPASTIPDLLANAEACHKRLHGESVRPSVRKLDEFIESGQNDTVGYQYSHTDLQCWTRSQARSKRSGKTLVATC